MPDGAQDVPSPDEPVTPHEALQRDLDECSTALADIVVSAREVVPVVLESVIGQGAEITAGAARLTNLESLAAELANADHLGFELQVAFSETEVMPAGLFVPFDSAGALFGLDGASKPPTAARSDARRESRMADRLREFLDLLSLTLFTDGLAGTEVTLADLHRGRAEWTLGVVQDVAQNTATARVDVAIRVESGATGRVMLFLPLPLLVRLAGPPRTERGAAPAAAKSAASRATPERASALSSLEATAGPARPVDLLVDDSLRVSVELGGSSLTAEEILELGPGSVVELNQLAGEPLDILVNDRLIARGEVLVVDEKFGVRITEISSPRQRANAIDR